MLDALTTYRARSERTAVVAPHGELSYRELLARVERTAEALRHRDMQAGDRILFWDAAKPAYLIALLACWRTGLVLVPLGSQAPPAWRDQVARRLGIALVAEGLPGLETGLLRPPAERQRSPDSDVVAIIMTSGTSGVPKTVPIHAGMALAAARSTIETFAVDEESIFLDYIPPFTVGGLFLTGLPMLLAGSRSLALPFSPFAFGEIVARQRPTAAILLPTMVAVLRQTSTWPHANLSCFRRVASGASIVPEAVAETLLACGVERFLHLYGLTECLTPVMRHSVSRGQSPAAIFTELCGDYQARVAPDGELWLKGNAVMRGYLGDPAANREAFEDGWFKTGDLFAEDTGSWRFVGRKKDILKVGGFSVSPAQTEKTMMEVPGVRNCAVAKDTLRSGHEALVAFIEGADVDVERVMAHCRAHLPPVQVPRRAVLVAAVPLNAMGKVDRAAVERMAGQP